MDNRSVSIALFGRSGSGKSFVADRFCQNYGYSLISTGVICRRICNEVFGEESKTSLNILSTKLREIDEDIWIHAAMRNATQDSLIIFDSIRYLSDYKYFRRNNFCIVKIESDPSLVVKRLEERGQIMSDDDRAHPSEWEVEQQDFDFTIMNDGVDISSIDKQIKVLFAQ